VENFIDNIKVLAQGANFIGNPIEISTKQAGSSQLILQAGASFAGRDYVILSGVTGTWPGVDLKGHHLPLNLDTWTMTAFTLINTPALDKFMGKLDGNGQATATFQTFSALPEATGLVMYFAYLVFKPVDLTSHHVYVLFTP
jgi:hypothetical protein